MPAMTHIPPITREARNWLVAHIHCDTDRRLVNEMPAPSDPLDAVRARFQSNGIQEITATDGDYALGYNGGYVTVWRVQDGAHWLGRGPAKPLQCLSPHAALIAELRKVENNIWLPSIHMDLIKRAADALEKQP